MGAMESDPIRTRRWTRKEYERLGELGILPEDEPVELIAGQLIVAEPKGTPHTTMVRLTARALGTAFGPGWLVCQQDPIVFDDESEPEPDVIVVPGTELDYFPRHPSHPALVIEVAESSLAFDRRHKGSLYARAGFEDYWIVNLVDWQVEVYRRPGVDATAELGWQYLDRAVVAPGATIVPLARPDVTIAVADILPEALRRSR
jgi:Uma2 family endonuclease